MTFRSVEHRIISFSHWAKRLKLGGAVLAMMAIVASCGSGLGHSDSANLPEEHVEASDLNGRTFTSTDVSGETLVADTRITTDFTADSLSVSAGCNTMTGGYSIKDEILEVATLASTRMACEPDLMAQDQWIATFLQDGPRVKLQDNELTLAKEKTSITLVENKDAGSEPATTGS